MMRTVINRLESKKFHIYSKEWRKNIPIISDISTKHNYIPLLNQKIKFTPSYWYCKFNVDFSQKLNILLTRHQKISYIQQNQCNVNIKFELKIGLFGNSNFAEQKI